LIILWLLEVREVLGVVEELEVLELLLDFL
jgi:hypothetical protein